MSLPGDFRFVRHRKIPVIPGEQERKMPVVSKNNVGVVVILKCASRSMLAGEGSVSMIGRDKMPGELHVFVRDPISRLRSAYQFFHGRPPVESYPELREITWEQFIDAVLAGDKNLHWKPVSEILSDIDQDVIPHKFENLSSEYPLGIIGNKNPSKPIVVDEGYRAENLRTMYAEDIALREAA